MSRLPPVSFLPSVSTRSPEDARQLARFKLDFTPRPAAAACLRHRMTAYQSSLLEMVFQTCRFPTRDSREFLASLLNTPPRKIQVWFQNRRQKLRAQSASSN